MRRRPEITAPHRFEELQAIEPETPPLEHTDPGDTALIVYASGTTGTPKGAELTHPAVDAAAAMLRARGLSVDVHVRRGDPALVLADVAADENAWLIVVRAGERSKLARRLTGGVADLVAERAPCDVLIVRPRDRPGATERHETRARA